MNTTVNVYIGSDHRGFHLKESLKAWLSHSGYSVVDCGNAQFEPTDDFPDYCFAVADKVISDDTSMGIAICGSGGGVTIAANKVTGIRCGQALNIADVIHNRRHNNMNVLAIGSDFVSDAEAKSMVDAFLKTPFGNEERFLRRLGKIAARECTADR